MSLWDRLRQILSSLNNSPLASESQPVSASRSSSPDNLEQSFNRYLTLATGEEESEETEVAAMENRQPTDADRLSLSQHYLGIKDDRIDQVFAVNGLVLVSQDQHKRTYGLPNKSVGT